jgi:REP element-mobilizing transposase RayT
MLRGNECRDIFLSEEDRQRFLETVFEKKQGNRFFLNAFCLMSNHVHLMLREGTEDIARAMKCIGISYVHYFNKKYKRTGHLFQDRFLSEAVEDDGYALALVRYIHRNPVKAGLVKTAAEYKWSSYLCYMDENHDFNRAVDREFILDMFSEDREKAKKLYENYINEEGSEEFMDLTQKKEVMDEEEARRLFKRLLAGQNAEGGDSFKGKPQEDVIREFRQRTNLSLRRIAAITGLNKDRVHKILREARTKELSPRLPIDIG